MEDKSEQPLRLLAASEQLRANLLQAVVGSTGILEAQMASLKELTDSIAQYSISRIELPSMNFSPLLSNFFESIKPAFDTFKRLNPVIAQAAVIMFGKGWWIVRFLPIAFYSKVIDIEDEITDEEVTKLITDYVNRKRCEQLIKIVNDWNVEAFQNRREIFEQALWCHTRKKYAVTVPALIVQIEGIIREFVATQDDGFTAWRLEPVMKRFKQKFSQIEAAPQKQQMEFNEVEAVMNYHNLKILEKLYAAYDPRSHADPSDVNRNAVSHGLWLSYSTKETSTKLFLLLDMLHSMLHQLKGTSNT